jgi:hypothetical protein
MLRQFGRKTVGLVRTSVRYNVSRAAFASEQANDHGSTTGFKFAIGALPIAVLLVANEFFSKKADNCGIVGEYFVFF